MHKSFLVTGINNNLNGANNHIVWSETDIKVICMGGYDDEVLLGFTAKYITAITADITLSLTE